MCDYSEMIYTKVIIKLNLIEQLFTEDSTLHPWSTKAR